MEYIILWLIGVGVALYAAITPKSYVRFIPQSPRVKTTIGLGYKVKVYK